MLLADNLLLSLIMFAYDFRSIYEHRDMKSVSNFCVQRAARFGFNTRQRGDHRRLRFNLDLLHIRNVRIELHICIYFR